MGILSKQGVFPNPTSIFGLFFLQVRLQQFFYALLFYLIQVVRWAGFTILSAVRDCAGKERVDWKFLKLLKEHKTLRRTFWLRLEHSGLPEGPLLHWCQHSCLSPSSPCCYLDI